MKTNRIGKRWSGFHAARLTDTANALERRFAAAWKRINTECGRDTATTPSLVDSLVDTEHGGMVPGLATDRDRQVASTVIQWLGSPVGEAWVRGVLRESAALPKQDDLCRKSPRELAAHARDVLDHIDVPYFGPARRLLLLAKERVTDVMGYYGDC